MSQEVICLVSDFVYEMHWLDHVLFRHISRSSSCVGGIRAVITRSAALVEPVPGRADGVGFIILFVLSCVASGKLLSKVSGTNRHGGPHGFLQALPNSQEDHIKHL